MRFAVCSLVLGDEYKRSVLWCTISQKQHARRHGYTRITDESIFEPRRDATWSKIPLLQKHLADWDWLMWIDGDVLITNQDRKIEEFIDLVDSSKFLFIGKDFQGLNAGVFIIRNCPQAHEFLKDVWAFEGYDRKLFHEQTAMEQLMPKYASGVQIVPHKYINIMNAYDSRMDQRVHWLPGDFCVHFAGVRSKTTPETFLQIQKMYIDRTSTDLSGKERIGKYAASLDTHFVDAFMFYNELDILELRLSILDQYVDQFVLVESELTHSGHSKPLFFEENKERFARWLPKIKHIVVTAEESPEDENPWSREKYQRECILRGLEGVSDDVYVMISDVDEIPDMLRLNIDKEISTVHMWMFEYSVDYLFTGEPWFGTVIARRGAFKSPNFLRDNRWKFPVHEYAGWHLSSFGDANHVALKHKTFAHWKDQRNFQVTPENFAPLIQQGVHTDGVTKLVPRPPQVPLPGCVELLYRLRLGKFS